MQKVHEVYTSSYYKLQWVDGVCTSVARTQPMPGHSVGTLRLRVASSPGPAQL